MKRDRYARAIRPAAALVFAAATVSLLALGLGRPPAALASSTPPPDGASAVEIRKLSNEGIELRIEPESQKAGTFQVALYQLRDNRKLGSVKDFHKARPRTVRIPAGGINPAAQGAYYLEWKIDDGPVHRRSLLLLSQQLQTRLIGHRNLVAGTRPAFRVLVKDIASGRPVSDAAVQVDLVHEENVLASVAGRSDEKGEMTAKIPLPDKPMPGAALRVTVKDKSQDTITETVNIEAPVKTLLTTDKPLYQPGQTIHIRSLSMNRATRKPVAEAEVLFEVEDAKGNKVFKKPMTTDAFGVASADFVLASELNKGTYRIRAIVDESREEKTVTVDRYVLPKFKVDFQTDRRFYQPGQTVKVDLQSDYFFGKPVAGGEVKVTCAKFDVGYQEFKTIEGKLDDSGHYHFEIKLPTSFVGQPVQQGKASVKFEIEVTDPADHKETVTRNVTVTNAGILVTAVPESGKLAPGLDNDVYLVATYPDARPAEAEITWTNAPDGKPVTVRTDKAGFAKVALTPRANQNLKMQLTAKDAAGHTGQASVDLQVSRNQDAFVLLRTDRALYEVGDRIELRVATTRKTGPLYIDVIKDKQTWLTRTVDLEDGAASTKIDLDPTLAGTVQINAWMLSPNGEMIRDQRVVIVDPANDLNIQVAANRQTYLPGTEATVDFTVTDAAGKPVSAALCVMVVDEAVFALQEMQPGLEKIYFYLEQEIAKPRYEIHGWELGDVWDDPQMPQIGRDAPDPAERKQQAARVLLASAEGAGDYSIHATSAEAISGQMQLYRESYIALQKLHGPIRKALDAFAKDMKEKKKNPGPANIQTLIDGGYLAKKDALDPWGQQVKIKGHWCAGCKTYHGFQILSAGIDGTWGTADDADPERVQRLTRFGRQFRNELRMARREDVREMAVADGAAMPAAEALPMDMAGASDVKKAAPAGSTGGSGAGTSPIRVRKYFPETLLFEPGLITDAKGQAQLTFPIADSITTWRMTMMGNSQAGALGSGTEAIRVFQDFFVDIDFPVALTQNDKVWVPVAIYNYLKTDQTVTLTARPGEWYELEGDAEVSVKLAPGEVTGVKFPITVKKIGFHRFTVVARGSEMSDAVARSVEVVPDGKEMRISASGRLNKPVTHTLRIPDGAIDEASKIFVKVYPGVLSQVVEGLDSILRMPGGCFEQTSSSTYPNILVLDYMKTTGKITPEIQMKAEGFINAGYQRLLSFECDGGGFEWFGRAPAHRILTAYGLMEFHDMSKVHEVDPAVIQRTQAWLAKCQEADGSYKPSSGGIREGAINKFTSDVFRNTAYITWALAQTGYQGPQVAKGLTYLEENLEQISDPYTLALAANAFAVVDPKAASTGKLIDRLVAEATVDGEKVYWGGAGETPTHGTGASADIETTGLAVQALIKHGRNLDVISKAVTYLSGNKDSFGTWHTTQATIQAMRAMIMAEKDATRMTEAKIPVVINGKTVKTLEVTKDNSDVMQLVDLKAFTRRGDNEVKLGFQGQGGLMYQIVGRYYEPFAEMPQPNEPLSIDVAYDRTELAANDIVTLTATVATNRPGIAKMVMVDLGIPPGFSVLPQKLQTLVDLGQIEKFSITGRQIIIYLREVVENSPVKIKVQMLAKYPIKAKTPKSVTYEYYNPKIRSESAPIELTVRGEN